MTPEELQRLTVSCRLLGTSVVDELRKIEEKHRMAWAEARDAYSELRGEAIRAATAKIDASLADIDAEVDALRDVYTASERDVEDAKVAVSARGGLKTDDGVLPVGTKVQRQKQKTYETVTQFGIVEVHTRQTLLPDRMAGWKVPSIGDVFVRLCMKDGTPGKRISEHRSDWKIAE